jgi:hypothetical protein
LLGQVTETIEAFEHEVRAAGASAEQTRIAKYILCAAADDIVQNIPGDDRHVWTQYSMLSRFFGERVGGVRFFEELDRAKGDPNKMVTCRVLNKGEGRIQTGSNPPEFYAAGAHFEVSEPSALQLEARGYAERTRD